MSDPDFIAMPYEVLKDKRLSLRQLRVLMAIYSWRKKHTEIARVSRDILAQKTGYEATRISSITTQLSRLGWLKKVGNGGRSQWIEYELKVPELDTVYEDKRVPESVTKRVPESGTRIDTVTNTVTNTVKKYKKKNAGFVLPEEVNPEAWAEFEQHRKEIKKPLTDLGRVKAANKLKEFTFFEQKTAIDRSIESGWSGLFPDKINGVENATSSKFNRPRSQSEKYWDCIKEQARATS